MFCNIWQYQKDVNKDLIIIDKRFGWNFKLVPHILQSIPCQLATIQPTYMNKISSLCQTLSVFCAQLKMILLTLKIYKMFCTTLKIIKLTLKIYSPISVTCLCEPLLDNRGYKCLMGGGGGYILVLGGGGFWYWVVVGTLS